MAKTKNGSAFSAFVTSNLIDVGELHLDAVQHQRQENTLPITFRLLSIQLALAACCISVLALIGYNYGVEYLYRPIPEGPATNPITAYLCLSLSLLLLISGQNNTSSVIRRFFIFTVFLVTIFGFIGYLFGVQLIPSTLFFDDIVHQELDRGLSNYLSFNTDIMLLLIACSQLFECIRRYLVSQLFAFFAIAIPCLSFIGYFYGIESFYSHMSLSTALLGFLLGWSSLSRTANQAGFRAVLGPYTSGKIVRIQILIGMFLPFLVGLFLLPYIQQSDIAVIAVFVIFLTWFMVLMICVSSMVHEQIELIRQEATDQLIKAANTDHLTGLLNRRKFFELTESEYKKAVRAQRDLTLLMVDVDDFKKINDTSGHSTGDEVLIRIAETLTNCVRDTDLVCRFGGEEFTILLFDSSESGIKRVCEKVLASVEALMIPSFTEAHGPVTVSIGTSLLNESNNLNSALKTADEAMYKSKQSGKNQVSYQV
ncbi:MULTISPECIES: diguanylate cyclase [unclassified Neptuniibacter]|uniref:GGDEF domain-containing protein n=1 Tax=unclassified Neptuniibacter TaxID=2630693 RepID=UPI000C39C5B9|nr:MULTISPECIES: diguanylate cyclase [unclassified Neptuniibacter]MAY41859.1 hypothetical protein [Oceanospirillaceae bacterium]|tara:strand:- start:5007 stop:6452 length:1446 start_codon:yes stop_codon:yes gene_type:complete